jgi:tetratricopeptide (TPR) repeat protein
MGLFERATRRARERRERRAARRSAVAAAALVCLSVAAVCLAVTSHAFAQAPPDADARSSRALSTAIQNLSPILRDDPRLAVQMLEALEVQYRGNPQVLGLLGDAYAAIGEADSAVVAYNRCLAANPNDVRAGASLGLLHVRNGDRDEADAVFQSLIARTGRSMNTYRTIGGRLAAAGFHDLALKIYEEGRRENKGHYVLTIDIAQLHRTMGDLEAAADDYLYLVESYPQQYGLARERVLDLFRDPRAEGAAADSLISRLVRAAAVESPQRRTFVDLLALVYLERGMLENALETALEAKSLGDRDGKVLFNLAERAALECRRQPPATRAKHFDMALRATEAFIDGHPDAPQIPQAKLMLVDLLMGLASGRVERLPGAELQTATAKALETLDWMIESYPGSEHAEAAYLKKGDIVFRVQKRPRDAIAVYQEGLSKSRIRPAAFAERLGRLYLVVGDYEQAGAYFTRLVNDAEPELHETGVYYAGLLLGINGQYEAARDTLTALAEGNPSSSFTNDAIDLAWAIEEGLQGDEKVLRRYVEALRHEVAEDTAQAVAALGEIADRPVETPLRARALFALAGIELGAGVFDKALDAFQTFVRDYPTDIRVPDAWRGIGRVYENGYGDDKRALETYEEILLSYPHYIFLDEVRQDVARLRNKLGAENGSS